MRAVTHIQCDWLIDWLGAAAWDVMSCFMCSSWQETRGQADCEWCTTGQNCTVCSTPNKTQKFTAGTWTRIVITCCKLCREEIWWKHASIRADNIMLELLYISWESFMARLKWSALCKQTQITYLWFQEDTGSWRSWAHQRRSLHFDKAGWDIHSLQSHSYFLRKYERCAACWHIASVNKMPLTHKERLPDSFHLPINPGAQKQL